MKKPSKPLPRRLQAQLDRCRRELSEIGIGVLGTVSERFMACGNPGCRCQADPPQLHGPYYNWTTKVEGKTMTRRVQPEDVEEFRGWIAEGQRLRALVQRWRELSLEAIDWQRKNR
jgi:hypothetical protein